MQGRKTDVSVKGAANVVVLRDVIQIITTGSAEGAAGRAPSDVRSMSEDKAAELKRLVDAMRQLLDDE